MVDKIYIVRHGFRLSWITNNWKSETGLPRDTPLAAYGVTQAEETARYFASLPEDERPTLIFSSPYYRCLQTVQPIAKALGLPIYVEHGLAEWYSPARPGSGLHPRPGSAESLKAHFPEIDPEGWETIWYPSRKGESLSEVHDRCGGFLNALLPEVDRRWKNKHQRILLVSHAATIIALIHELEGDRTKEFRVGCCTLSELERKPGEDTSQGAVGKFKATKRADGAHMEKGADREWGFQDVEVRDGMTIDQGIPGTENDADFPVGCQLDKASQSSNL
ncbi:PGAM-domain-containing protein [Schizophyllum commune H4-8]|uniref:Phosphoglycerate mutase-like protein n=1 Tax=Schizophyllum commune (strain H4-8 / FGSC 9210) TaxID=578458 RepID=D8PPR0_SCHCM|nr:PGAM-domain-containing protein [Schizophyllum commune H4-8]KAI5898340.1 PGAM-domain-containing protein [Schizophyllum commune H4-8]